MDRITSRDNALVREVKRLLGDAGYRRKSGRFVLEGARLCEEGARFAKVQTALYTAHAAAQYPAVLSALRATGAPMIEIGESVAGYIADTQTPQGLFCVCAIPAATETTVRPQGRYLALEDVRDPGNLGTIIRTAEAFGLDALILSEGCCDVYNPKVLRGSMGGALRLPIRMVADLPAAVGEWNRQGLRTFACVADREAVPVTAASLGTGCVCLIGNEGAGLTKAAQTACSERITIPMAGRAESLNAAVAACLVMWELTRPGNAGSRI